MHEFERVLTTTTENVEIGSIIGLLLYGGLSVFGLADSYQLCYSAKDVKSLKKGMGFAIIPILFIAFLLLLIGLYVLDQNQTLDPDMVFIFAIQNLVNQS